MKCLSSLAQCCTSNRVEGKTVEHVRDKESKGVLVMQAEKMIQDDKLASSTE